MQYPIKEILSQFRKVVTWCNKYSDENNPKRCLRISEDYYDFENNTPYAGFSNLSQCQKLISSLCLFRDKFQLSEQNLTYRGKILVYHPNQSTCDYSASIESKGFFGECDNPPADTWFYSYEDSIEGLSILCWIPQEFIQYAEDVIAINAPPGITQWLEVENYELYLLITKGTLK